MNKKTLAFSAVGLVALAMAEGFSPKAYFDGVAWTNGFGNTHNVDRSKTVTVQEGLKTLQYNVVDAEQIVRHCITADITQGQFDAYVSFVYNVGGSKFCKSTMVKYANAGEREKSCNELLRWVYVAGKDCRIRANNCAGIVTRRELERKTCLAS